ncbi:MAG: hypothetical protein HRT57_01295 [Crocinitomicaceae bacterium]|nr:hypothetical protein [Crocinitomicaceae bacterium]
MELIHFSAKYDAVNTVQLNWSTASEINNDLFTVERSKDGAGNANSTLTYYDLDRNPLNGISYYRLKQTDFDGSISSSEI